MEAMWVVKAEARFRVGGGGKGDVGSGWSR